MPICPEDFSEQLLDAAPGGCCNVASGIFDRRGLLYGCLIHGGISVLVDTLRRNGCPFISAWGVDVCVCAALAADNDGAVA